MENNETTLKKERLVSRIEKAGTLLVAYSGGVDSTFLLAVAHETLGQRVVAATAVSAIFPLREEQDARTFTREQGIEHVFFRFEETALPAFVSNRPDRCYHCKKSLFQKMLEIARDRGIHHVAHGANADDLEDSLSQIKRLCGMLSICAGCKKIRNERGGWTKIEDFIEAHTNVEFSHGICPDCARDLYPELQRK